MYDCDNCETSEDDQRLPPEERDFLYDDELLLTAPTGRASSILGKRVGIKACTLHQIIYSFLSF